MSRVQSIIGLVATVAIVASVSGRSHAQSHVYIGGNQDAQTCHQLAEQAVIFNASQSDDIEVCERALEFDQVMQRDMAATLVNYGIVLMSNSRPDEAERAYQKALAINANLGETYINIANVYFVRKDYLQAAQTYSKGLPLMKGRKHVGYLNRGLAHEYLGEFTQAAKDYQQALQLRPEWVRAKKMLARAEAKQEPAE